MERAVPHTGLGLTALADALTALVPAEPSRIAVAIEVPRGAVVDTLVERGLHVFAINPKQLDRFRDRHTVAGAKDDRRDAFVLADSLRTDRPAFRPVQPEHPRVVELRELSRVDDDLSQEIRRLSNRLRDQLHRFFPQALPLCPAADEPWFWALLDRAPTPARAQRLAVKTVAAVLKVYRIRRVTVEAIRAALQSPPVHVAPGTAEAASAHMALLLPRLRLLHEQRTQVATRIETLLEELGAEENPGEHRDATILRSLPGVGRVVAATMLAEAARASGRARLPDPARPRRGSAGDAAERQEAHRRHALRVQPTPPQRLLSLGPLQYSVRPALPGALRSTPESRTRTRPSAARGCRSLTRGSRRYAHEPHTLRPRAASQNCRLTKGGESTGARAPGG